MTKAKRFYAMMASLYELSGAYMNWLGKNPNVKVISTVYDKNTLLVTYEEIE